MEGTALNRYDSDTSEGESSVDSLHVEEIRKWKDRGVSIELLFHLMREHGLAELSVDEVIRRFVRPQTMEYDCSLAAVMKNSFPDTVGKSTHFVSYSRKTPFVVLMNALYTITESTKQKVFFWIDFCALDQNNHHAAISDPDNWLYRDKLLQKIKNTISSINNTTAILYPRNDPYLLKRSWCLFECFATLQHDSPMLWFYTENGPLVPNPSDFEMFENFEKTVQLFKPDFEMSSTSAEHEKSWLKHAVSSLDAGGVSRCNEKLGSMLYEWLAEQALLYFERTSKKNCSDPEKRLSSMLALGKLLESLGFIKPAYFLLKTVQKESSSTTLGLQILMAEVNHDLGCLQGKHFHRFDEAEELLHVALQTRKLALGETHEKTCESMEALGRLLQALERTEEAGKLFEEALRARIERNGFECTSTLVSANLQALFLQSCDRIDEAEELFRKIVKIGRKVLGRRNKDVFIWINNLAVLLQDTGRADEAEHILRRTLAVCEHTYGPHHPCTLNLVHNLGQCLWVLGRHFPSETLFRRELVSCDQVYGRTHTETIKALRNLLSLLKSQDKVDEMKNILQRFSAEKPENITCKNVENKVESHTQKIPDIDEFASEFSSVSFSSG